MSSDPAARFGVLVEATSRLKQLHREMIRLAARDGHYESNQQALRTAIRELQSVIVEAGRKRAA